jgi:hypothetical protein
MSITHPAKGYRRRSRRGPSFGPQAAFLATMAVVGTIIVAGLLPHNLMMPAVSTLLFVLASVFALIAWVRCSTDEYGVTYWDVAGAVVLVGICTAALIEPAQLSGLIAGAHTEN